MNMVSHETVQALIDGLLSAIDAAPDVPDNSDIEPLLLGLRCEGEPTGVRAKGGMPALDHLPVAIRNAGSGPDEIRSLAESFEKLADSLPWYQRQEPALPDFMHGHANAFIIGPQGLEERGGVTVGVSFLAPGVEYPNHNHPPQELYVVMSEGDWRQNDDPWHAPGLGGLVYNPANITHSMRSSQQPLLAIWCLWT